MKSFKCHVKLTIEADCMVRTDATATPAIYIDKLAVEAIEDNYDIDLDYIQSTGGGVLTDVTIEEVKE